MGVRENKVETYLNRKVECLGGITRKWVSPGRNGVLDRIVILRGRILFVEVKTVDGVLSTAQKREIDRLKEHGSEVRVVYGKEGVDELIEELEDDINNDTAS